MSSPLFFSNASLAGRVRKATLKSHIYLISSYKYIGWTINMDSKLIPLHDHADFNGCLMHKLIPKL